jgi:hypothetical protein
MIMVLVPGQATRKQREAAADRQVVDTEPDSGEAAETADLEATDTAETVAPATDTTAPEATQPETPSEAAVAEDQPTEPTSA